MLTKYDSPILKPAPYTPTLIAECIEFIERQTPKAKSVILCHGSHDSNDFATRFRVLVIISEVFQSISFETLREGDILYTLCYVPFQIEWAEIGVEKSMSYEMLCTFLDHGVIIRDNDAKIAQFKLKTHYYRNYKKYIAGAAACPGAYRFNLTYLASLFDCIDDDSETNRLLPFLQHCVLQHYLTGCCMPVLPAAASAWSANTVHKNLIVFSEAIEKYYVTRQKSHLIRAIRQEIDAFGGEQYLYSSGPWALNLNDTRLALRVHTDLPAIEANKSILVPFLANFPGFLRTSRLAFELYSGNLRDGYLLQIENDTPEIIRSLRERLIQVVTQSRRWLNPQVNISYAIEKLQPPAFEQALDLPDFSSSFAKLTVGFSERISDQRLNSDSGIMASAIYFCICLLRELQVDKPCFATFCGDMIEKYISILPDRQYAFEEFDQFRTNHLEELDRLHNYNQENIASNFSSCIQEHTKISSESCFEEIAHEITSLINAKVEADLHDHKPASSPSRRVSNLGKSQQAKKLLLCEHVLFRCLNIFGVTNYYKSYIFYTLNSLYNEN